MCVMTRWEKSNEPLDDVDEIVLEGLFKQCRAWDLPAELEYRAKQIRIHFAETTPFLPPDAS